MSGSESFPFDPAKGSQRRRPRAHCAATGTRMKTLDRTKENPLPLKSPPGTADYTMHADTRGGLAILVRTLGKTVLHSDARCLADLHAMLKKHGDWMDLGGADEQKPAKEGTVESWGRSAPDAASLESGAGSPLPAPENHDGTGRHAEGCVPHSHTARGPMPLFLANVDLYRARLFGMTNDE